MTINDISQATIQGLPPVLTSAQETLNREVQTMLNKLSEFQIGIFMPHTHDEKTGAFQLLGDDVVQVESGLEVSFKTANEITSQRNSFLPVGWLWRAGQSAPVAVCEMVAKESTIDEELHANHKMKTNI